MAANPQTGRVLSFDEARRVVESYCQKLRPPAKEPVDILAGLGRILAEPLTADRDFPPFPRATRDGYAVRAADVETVPAVLRIAGEVKAGGSYGKSVRSGEAVEIMTGAPVPEGVDAVVMVEFTAQRQETVEIRRSCAAGENVVPAGSEARAGDAMVPRGVRIDYAHIAVAAAVGKSKLQVHLRPQVAILPTGDELVEIAERPEASQIRNSNSYSLAAQVAVGGGRPVQLPIGRDEKHALRKIIEEGLGSDLLLLSGGVSMGKFDLVEQVLTELGAQFFFTGALIQPGKPVVFGELRGKPFFGLPGNPVSTMVTFELFVQPVVQALGGALPVRLPTAQARLKGHLKVKTGLTRFLPARLRGSLLNAEVEVVQWQGSGDLMAAAQANCYVIAPPDREQIQAGEMVAVLMRSN